MLQHLTIKNIVLIESLHIEFTKGLCVLTGETGAGKSILLDSLGLALGEKSSSRYVRSGQAQGMVTASFDISSNVQAKNFLAANDLEYEDDLLLRRVVFETGKSKAYINDAPVSAKLLQNLASTLVEIHGQHDQKNLFNAQKHREMFDLYAGNHAISVDVKAAFQAWKKVEKKYAELCEQAENARRDEDYLRHVCEELKHLSPEVDEDVQLAERRTQMMSVSKIFDVVDDVSKQVTKKTDVMHALFSAEKILTRLPHNIDESLFKPLVEALERAAIEMQEVLTNLDEIRDNVTFDEKELEELEDRLFLLRDMARKYNIPVSELATYADQIKEKIQTLDTSEAEIQALNVERKELREVYITTAKRLTASRKAKTSEFSVSIEAELKPLKMENCKFNVELHHLEEVQWNEQGMEGMEFLVQTNPGSPFGPIKNIASGGEMSRFMVSLKVVLADKNTVPTMIFDEIDTGIGGATSDAVGRRLAILGDSVQVMCVTHQPQVAGYGSCHLRIEKQMVDKKMQTSVYVINQGEKIEELARMLAGENVTDEARAAARNLINQT